MHRQSGLAAPTGHLVQRAARRFLRRTLDHEVVRVARHLEARLRHVMVQGVEIQVGQQGADHRALGRTDRRNPPSILLLDRLLQERLDQIEGASIGDPTLHQGHQGRVRDRVEIRLEVHVHDPEGALPQQGVDALQCHLRRALRTEAVAVIRELVFEDRLDGRPQRRLHDAIAHRRNPQRPQLLAACLGDVTPSNRGGSVGPVPQRFVQRRQVARLVALEGLDRHVVDADAALVGLHSREGRLQAAQRQDLIDHAVPTSSFHPALQGLHHPRRPDGGLYPGVSSWRLSVGISPRGHCRRRPLGGVGHVGCTLLSSGHHVSTFLAPFAPLPVTALRRSLWGL
jgi:hypothetical protein